MVGVDRANKPAALDATASRGPQATVDVSGDKVTAKLPTGESVEILLFGASVISWKDASGRENLWLSTAAKLDGSKPVRGGVPVVFPNFGPAPKDHATSKLPQHGFARNVRWEFLGKSNTESDIPSSDDNSVKLDFGLYSSALPENFRKDWPYDFGLVYSVTLSPKGLQTMMNVRNEGKEAFEFQMLLHTYLRIKDISQIKVNGLASVTYVDKMLNATEHQQSDTSITFTGEVDRVYRSIPQSTTSVVEGGQPRFDIVRDNLADTVLWNPWIEKAKGMGDFEPKDGYKEMVAVEVGAVEGWQKLEAGEAWEGGQLMKSL